MGLGGISPWSLVLILVIVLLLFGTKKLRGLGGDLGGALKGFKKAMTDDESDVKKVDADDHSGNVDNSMEKDNSTVEKKETTEAK